MVENNDVQSSRGSIDHLAYVCAAIPEGNCQKIPGLHDLVQRVSTQYGSPPAAISRLIMAAIHIGLDGGTAFVAYVKFFSTVKIDSWVTRSIRSTWAGAVHAWIGKFKKARFVPVRPIHFGLLARGSCPCDAHDCISVEGPAVRVVIAGTRVPAPNTRANFSRIPIRSVSMMIVHNEPSFMSRRMAALSITPTSDGLNPTNSPSTNCCVASVSRMNEALSSTGFGRWGALETSSSSATSSPGSFDTLTNISSAVHESCGR
jgi:hypothetical protein